MPPEKNKKKKPYTEPAAAEPVIVKLDPVIFTILFDD